MLRSRNTLLYEDIETLPQHKVPGFDGGIIIGETGAGDATSLNA